LVLYMLVVLPVAIVWGTGLAAVTAVLSVGVYLYLFVPPIYSFRVGDWRAGVALGVFLIAAIAVGQLAARLRQAALESDRLSAEQAALRRVATLVARGAPPPAVFAAVAEEVGNVLPAADVAVVGRYGADQTIEFVGGWSRVGPPPWVGQRVSLGGHNVATLVLESNEPARVARLATEAKETTRVGAETRSSAGAPINVQGHLWGTMIVGSERDEPLPADTEERLAAFTELVAIAIANAESQAALTASRARIVTTADTTRHRIERDLHDGAQQRLVSLALQLRAAQAAAPPEARELAQRVDEVAAGLASVLEELREIARGIHPAILAEGGLHPALKALARRCAVPVRLDVQMARRLPEPIEIAAYYTVSEAPTNTAKHGRASAVDVDVRAGDGVVDVRIRDDGCGGAAFGHGSGLVGLKDRVEALGGRLSLHSPPGAGTTMEIALPLGDPSRPGLPSGIASPADESTRDTSR
jgi:signal transduction histidine kinase